MGELTMDKFSYGNPVRRGVGNNVIIGKYCSIAQDVVFDGGFTHETKFVSTYPFHSGINPEVNSNIRMRGDIVIGNDVWIGEGAVIMSGITIADGAVIGCKAIVTRNVEAYNIVVGSPARPVNKRFLEDKISMLLILRWWDWPDEKVKENAHLLASYNIDEFLNKHYGLKTN